MAEPADEELYGQFLNEVFDREDQAEELLRSMMNLAWYALINLKVLDRGRRSAADWLRAIAQDLAEIESDRPSDG